MVQGRKRTFSVCLSDLPKDKMFKHDNGKIYIQLASYDYEETDQYNKDFSVSIPRNKEEAEQKANITFVGNGKIWPDTDRSISNEEADDLPF